jgi:hypothetical protein
LASGIDEIKKHALMSVLVLIPNPLINSSFLMAKIDNYCLIKGISRKMLSNLIACIYPFFLMKK